MPVIGNQSMLVYRKFIAMFDIRILSSLLFQNRTIKPVRVKHYNTTIWSRDVAYSTIVCHITLKIRLC